MKHKNTALAQTLRKNQTKEEAKLWYQFLRLYPLRFRRQFQIDPYIVDFYCAKAKLVVELDGSQHYDPQRKLYDTKRTLFLKNKGLTVLRFTNTEVNLQFKHVCEAIHKTVLLQTMQED